MRGAEGQPIFKWCDARHSGVSVLLFVFVSVSDNSTFWSTRSLKCRIPTRTHPPPGHHLRTRSESGGEVGRRGGRRRGSRTEYMWSSVTSRMRKKRDDSAAASLLNCTREYPDRI